MTTIGSGVEFVNVSVIVAPVLEFAAGRMPVTKFLVHIKVGTGAVLLLVILYVFDTLLHQLAVALLVMIAVGLTVTATLFTVPVHPLTLGVIT